MIALCIPVRLYVLPKIFTEDELILLDSDPNTVKMWLANQQVEDDEDEPLLGEDDEEEDADTKGESGEGGIESKTAAAAEGDAPKQPRKRVKRKKTVSCPTGALMFSEEPSVLGPQLKPMFVGGAGMMMMGTNPASRAEDGTSSDTSDTMEGIDLASNSQPRRRPRASREQRRSNSCPVPNMFFQVELVTPSHVRGLSNDGLPTLHEGNHSQHSVS